MGVKYEWKSEEIVLTTAENLKKATELLTQVALEMQQNGMKEALFPWTQRQWDCLDIVLTLAHQCQAVLPAQIAAKKQNRPSQFELAQKKSRRDVAVRKLRNSALPPTPPKPRGRPRKST